MQRYMVIERSGKNRIEKKHISFHFNAYSLSTIPILFSISLDPNCLLIKLMLFSRELTGETPINTLGESSRICPY